MGRGPRPAWRRAEVKQTVRLREIQERMAPGVIARDGFLGGDGRALADILAADAAELARLGLSAEAVAGRMAELRDAGYPGLGEIVEVPPHLAVRVDSERGRLPCPFGDSGGHRKTLITVENRKLGRSVAYTDLGIHLIREHGFFEGSGSPFRLEPADLKTILEIGEGR
jgi:hypothetical protein